MTQMIERSGDLLSLRQTARRLDVSDRVMQAAMREGQIPTVAIGKRKYVPKVALEEWLKASGGNVMA
jgi:excisionase family DNA binding protein